MREEILRLAKVRAEALVTRDIDVMNGLLSPDFLYTNSKGDVFDKDRYLEMYVKAPSVKWKSQDLVPERMVAHQDFVVLIGRVHDVATFGALEIDASFRTTQIYRRTNGHWEYLAGHTSNLG